MNSIIFDPKTGQLQGVYADELREVYDALGMTDIRRASHVEPGADGQWYVDFSPIGVDERLGPFTLRSDALAAEVARLRELGY